MDLLLSSLVSNIFASLTQRSVQASLTLSEYFLVHHAIGGAQALRNAPIAATISHLQHAAATLPWNVRVAAVQGLAKVRHLLPCIFLWQKRCSADL